MDEAMHPLSLLAVGMYGRVPPNQNGAPLRLVVPWKYGFKSIKSIVRISFVREQPRTTWQSMAPEEYGFYANVNPQVSHPRWSQARERRLPCSLFSPNVRDTLLFNGYADQVADLYASADLTRTTDALPVVAAVYFYAPRACLYWLWSRPTLALGPDPERCWWITLQALVLLLLTLAMTPLQRVTGWGGWLRCAGDSLTLVLQLCIAASR